MRPIRAWSVALLAAMSLVVAGCGEESDEVSTGSTASPAQAEDVEITLALNWTPLADHAPYFVAKEKGWYDEAGLQVETQFAKGSADSTTRVATGQAEIAVADAGTVIASQGKGGDVTIVGMLFAESPLAIWTTKDSGITSPADLAGKTVGVPTGDTQRVLWPALAEENGVDPGSVTFVNVAPSAKYSALASGEVDAIFDFTTGRPFVEKAVGADAAVVIPWAENGVNLYGNALVANDELLAEHAEAVEGFLDATYRAWQWTFENPDEAIEILKAEVPEIDPKSYRQNLDLVMELFDSESYAENGIGHIAEERMCETVEVVSTYIEMPEAPECSEVYTNEYLPEYELPASVRSS
jgi:NitT/TauT family transport system substrate-binding protein